jgi:HAD superfamily hydrolase (TIGR01484 family)
MKPVDRMSREEAAALRYVLMDIDDTLTTKGKLPAASYNALWVLKNAGFKLIPVTGRPAGWCDLIAREWPVDGVVGENGALAFWEENRPGRRPVLRAEYHPQALANDHPVLERIKARALAEFPELRVAKDQFARRFDLALDFAEEDPVLSLDTAEQVKAIALEEGAHAKVSSIHINIWMGNYDKPSMVELFLARHFGWISGAGDREVIFVGDSPNDEPMFVRFPLSCAVANIRRYKGLIKIYPAFMASRECGDGFAEIAAAIMEKRKN